MLKGRVRARKATEIYFRFTTWNSDASYQLSSDLPGRFVEAHHSIKISKWNLKLECAFKERFNLEFETRLCSNLLYDRIKPLFTDYSN